MAQRWYAGTARPEVDVRMVVELVGEPDAIVRVVAEATDPDTVRTTTYHLVLGVAAERPRGLLDQHFLGEAATESGRRVVFDALAHPDVAVRVGMAVFPDRKFSTAEPRKGDFSNTSVVFDERFVFKVFRILQEGPNPDVEVTRALGSVGFAGVAVPLEVWADGATDLGVLRTFERSSGSAADLAAASLATLFEHGRDPRVAKGDMAADSRALGAMVAQMHVGLAQVFGTDDADGPAWSRAMSARLGQIGEGRLDPVRLAVIFDRLAAAPDLGRSVRIHGALGLEQALRLKKGWLLLDFEGDPTLPLSDRRRTSSPLRDVAAVTRSFQLAASQALRERQHSKAGVGDQERLLAAMWSERNMNAFLTGYASVDDVHPLLPHSRQSRDALLSVFEIDAAVFELAQDLAHQPELADLPAAAVSRMLDADPPLPEFPAAP